MAAGLCAARNEPAGVCAEGSRPAWGQARTRGRRLAVLVRRVLEVRRLRGLVDPDEPQRAGREEDVLPLLDELEAGRVQVRQRHVGSNGLLDSAILHAVRDVLDERVL